MHFASSPRRVGAGVGLERTTSLLLYTRRRTEKQLECRQCEYSWRGRSPCPHTSTGGSRGKLASVGKEGRTNRATGDRSSLRHGGQNSADVVSQERTQGHQWIYARIAVQTRAITLWRTYCETRALESQSPLYQQRSNIHHIIGRAGQLVPHD